jgi:sugar lactone lactonase YvrE
MDIGSLSSRGRGLKRPECVLAHSSGWAFCSDAAGRGGVALVSPTGSVQRIEAAGLSRPLNPNGIALLNDGSFLIAHLGSPDGGVFRLFPDGRAEPYLSELNGRDLPPTNFVSADAEGRVWVCVSTNLHPRSLAYRESVRDGYIILVDRKGAKVVADGLGYTNECAVDLERGFLFVNETFSRRVSRFRIRQDGTLTDRHIAAEFSEGTFPDGVSLDVEGGLWITSVVSNRLIHVGADGKQSVELEDGDPDYLASVEAAYCADKMGLTHISAAPSKVLKNCSSVAFGGASRTEGLIGSLGNDRISVIGMPVAGVKPSHWDYRLPFLPQGATPSAGQSVN